MDFEYRETITHPAAQVYGVLRDRLEELPPFLPGVELIETLEREPAGEGRHRIVRQWHATPDTAPAAVRPFITRKMTTWKDHALWIDEAAHVEWWFETLHFDKLYECRGVNYVEDQGNGTTVLRLTGGLVVHPDNLPGVPRFLSRKLAPKIERWVMNMVTPNLAQMPKALQAFLDSGRA